MSGLEEHSQIVSKVETDCHTFFFCLSLLLINGVFMSLCMPCCKFGNKEHLVMLRGCNTSTTCHPAWLVSRSLHLQERCHCVCFSDRLFRLGVPTILPPRLNLTELPSHPDPHSRIPPPLKSPFNGCLSLGPVAMVALPPLPVSVLSDSQGLQHLETKFPRNPASVPA